MQIRTSSLTETYLAKMKQYVPRAMNPMIPAFIERADGVFYFDSEGKKWLDFTGGWGCAMVGHRNPKVVKRAKRQINSGVIHTDFSIAPYRSYVDLAERLVKLSPGESLKQAVFFNSGAEAIENAVKIARYYTERPAVIVFDGAFHGRTLMALTMTHKENPYKERFGPLAPQVFRVNFPNPYSYNVPWKKIEAEIIQKVHAGRIACIAVEPIQGEGGFRVPTDDFLPGLREFTEKNQIVFIADEIQSGFGRTGKFFAYEHWNVEPDLVTVAKSIAGGFPLSGVIGKLKILAALPEGAIGGTFVGNPVACAAALGVLDFMQEENLLSRVEKLGGIILERFRRIQENNEIVGDVRGKGIMIGIELVTDRTRKSPAAKQLAELHGRLLERGLLTAKAGLHSNVLRLLVPAVIPEDVLSYGLDIIEEEMGRVNR